MTLRDVVDAVNRGEGDDIFLTLRQVAELGQTPYKTIQRWRAEGSMPVVLTGPHQRPRVTGAVFAQMFCPHRKPAEPRPVKYAPSRYRHCTPPASL